MRLHHLRIEAFGPFGDAVEIDFDELNDAGQFLISGATGSGKTFILDSVCFALYGEVPGERQRAKHLRSDHSAPGAEPRVTLVLTVADRVLRISRSPSWERPKRRGEGTTTQQASVRLEQQIDGAWQVLATRLDEVGHLIGTWLGMTAVQFTQVALLPQGGFQTFLHSPTAARQTILQRLFRTDRFERVEKWFGEFRRQLNRSRSEALHGIDVVIHRLAEAAGDAEPPSVDDGIEALQEWAALQTAAADSARQAAADQLAVSTSAHQHGRRALEDATAVCTLLDRAEAARLQLRQLDDSADAFEVELDRLRAHRSASSLRPLIAAHADAREAARQAHDVLASALVDLQIGEVDADDIGDLASRAAEDVARSDQALSLASALTLAEGEHQDAREVGQQARTQLADARSRTAAIPAELDALAARLQVAREAEVGLAACGAELVAAQRSLAAAIELDQVHADLAAKEQARRLDQDRVQDLRQEYQDAREARIEAMASELAVGLVVGCSCPVCGSTSHPAPAHSAGTTGRKVEERARRRYESASVELNALDEVLAGLRARASSLAVTAGSRSAEDWERTVDRLQSDHRALSDQASTITGLRELESALKRQLEAAQHDLASLVQTEAEASARLAVLDARVNELRADLTSVLGDHPDAATLAAHARAHANRAEVAVTALAALRAAEALGEQHRATLDQQAGELGFASGSDAEGALLDEREADAIAATDRERDRARFAAGAVLDDPAVRAHLEEPRPDLGMLQAQAADAEAALAVAQAQARVTEDRAARTRSIASDLTGAVNRYRPLEAKAEQVTALSGLLEGTGADNRLRMRLSAFVLAERLRQVIAAANARLEVISEGRYVLSYQEERGAGENRGGLSLSVLDEWTGIRRDPTTLSGGETFVVSLCLALGLADTVADESGGLRIDTLFIDEGFGSLDAQTLDSVIDILAQLSQGGRVTGVVSHVQELRERLPAVLEVIPSKSGSTVRRASA